MVPATVLRTTCTEGMLCLQQVLCVQDSLLLQQGLPEEVLELA